MSNPKPIDANMIDPTDMAILENADDESSSCRSRSAAEAAG